MLFQTPARENIDQPKPDFGRDDQACRVDELAETHAATIESGINITNTVQHIELRCASRRTSRITPDAPMQSTAYRQMTLIWRARTWNQDMKYQVSGEILQCVRVLACLSGRDATPTRSHIRAVL